MKLLLVTLLLAVACITSSDARLLKENNPFNGVGKPNQHCLNLSMKWFNNTYPPSLIMTGFFVGWGRGIVNDLLNCSTFIGAIENDVVTAMEDFEAGNYTGLLVDLGNAFDQVGDALVSCVVRSSFLLL